jgi:hypothetical protein
MEPNDYIKLIIKAYKNSFGHFVPGVNEDLDTFHGLFKDEIISFQKTYNKNNFISELQFFTHCIIALENLEETIEYYPFILSNKIHSEIKQNIGNKLIINELEQKLKDISFDKFYYPIDKLGIDMDGFIYNRSIKIMLDIIIDLQSNILNTNDLGNFCSDDLELNESIKKTSNEESVDLEIKKASISNYFNKNCYDLFLYLVENYEKKDKVKFINIFYYLNYYADKNSYHFKFTQEIYSLFIKKNYSIVPKSFKKAVFDDSSEKYTLNSLEENFRSLKSK